MALTWKNEQPKEKLKWKDETSEGGLRWKDEAEQSASPPLAAESMGSKVKRITGSAGTRLLKGANQLGALGTDLIMAPCDLISGAVNPDYEYNPYTKGVMPRFKGHEELMNKTIDYVGQKTFNFKHTPVENAVGGIAEIIPSLVVGGGITKAAGLVPTVESAALAATERLGSKTLGKAAGTVVKDTPDMLNTWLMTEAPKEAENRTSLPAWGAEWLGGNLLLKGAGKGISAGTKNFLNHGNKVPKMGDITPEGLVVHEPTPKPSLDTTVIEPAPGVTVPHSQGGTSARGLSDTAKGLRWIDEDLKQGLEQEAQAGGRGTYEPITNANTLEQARQLLDQDADAVTRRILSKEPTNALDNTAGLLLVRQANDTGDYGMAVDIVEALAAKATSQGQAIQALSMWGRLTPEGMLRYGQKVIDGANAQNRRMGGSKNRFKMSEETAGKIVDLMDEAGGLEGRPKDVKVAQALDEIAAQVHPSILRKIATLQTMAQLLNPKTAIRNVVGNTGFQVLENVSDVIGTGIDKGVSLFTGQRSKVLPSMGTQAKGMVKGWKLGLEDALKGVDTSSMAGGKFDLPTTRTFRSGPLGVAEKAMNIELRASDRAFYQAAYDESLRQQMAAAAKSGKAVGAPTDAMHEVANHDALYRTFQDSNALSNAFVGIKRALNAGKEFGIGDFILKYPKTPSNLLARGLEYSPAGLLKTIMEAGKPLMGREFNQKAFVESFSRAITGTTTGVGTGAILHRMGIITGGPDEDWDVAAMNQQAGFGQYRLNASGLKRFISSGFDPDEANIRPGDITFSYDWFQPWAIALAMGADIDAHKGQAAGITGTLLNALATGVNAFADQPVVQGLQTVFGQREPAQAIPAVLKGVPASFVPTLLNQIKQLSDNQKRNTYDPSFVQEMTNKAQTRIPGLADDLPQSYGTLGQELTTYQEDSHLTDNNPWNVFFNPAFVNKYTPTPEAQMVLDIYKNTGETKQVPKTVDKYFTFPGGQKITLTAQEYSDMQKQVGELTQQGFSRIPTDTNDEEKIKRMGDVMTDAGKEAKITILENRGIPLPDSWMKGAGYVIRATNKGDTEAAKTFITKSYQNNAYNLYDYGKKHGMVDENGNPDEQLIKALSTAWETQTVSQSKSAAYRFLKDACESNNEEQAIKWAGVAKQSGLTVKEAVTKIRQAARPSTPGAKTPTIEQVLQGGYDVDPVMAKKILWAMDQQDDI